MKLSSGFEGSNVWHDWGHACREELANALERRLSAPPAQSPARGPQTGRQAGRQADRRAGKQAGRQADRQAGRKTDRQARRDWAAGYIDCFMLHRHVIDVQVQHRLSTVLHYGRD